MYLIASPVCGWNEHIDPTDELNQWKDPRACVLCRTCGDDDADRDPESPSEGISSIARMGRLLPMSDGIWVHASCALWSSEVYESVDDGTIHNMEKARARGGQLKCFGCGRPGATLGCFNKSCCRNYHMPCAKACGCGFTEKKQMLCEAHKSHATGLVENENIEHMRTLMIDEEKKAGALLINEKDASESGDAMLCSRVGSLVVHSLGEIDQKHDGFHSERFITPAGYVATRIFWSGLVPRTRTVYVLKVERSPSSGHPVFSAISGDDPASPIRAKSVNDVYNILIQRVKHANKEYFSHGDLFSKHPAARRTYKKAFGLNGPQVRTRSRIR
jgi:histone-lysine N-methyltransferase MLL3